MPSTGRDDPRNAALEGGGEQAEGPTVQSARPLEGRLPLLEAIVGQGGGGALNEGVGVHDI